MQNTRIELVKHCSINVKQKVNRIHSKCRATNTKKIYNEMGTNNGIFCCSEMKRKRSDRKQREKLEEMFQECFNLKTEKMKSINVQIVSFINIWLKNCCNTKC